MARIRRDARLDTRDARLKLEARHKPYWHSVHPGLFLGYRRGRWIVRRLVGKRQYREKGIGIADDVKDANGVDVLSYAQATREAHEAGDELGGVQSSQGYTVADAVRDYLAWYRHHGRAEGERELQSLQKTKAVFKKHVLPFLGERPVVELTTEELGEWRDNLALNGMDEMTRARKATANRIANALKAALTFARDSNKAVIPSDDAWRRLKSFRKVGKARVRYLSVEESSRLLNGCETDFRKIVHGGFVTGARYGELRHVQIEDYHPDSEILTIQRGKTGERKVYLTEEGAEVFESLTAGRPGKEHIFLRADGEPWQPSQQTRRMKEACIVAKIDPVATFYTLRHTYSAHLTQRGVSFKVIAESLGHTTTRMVELHYGHLAPSYIRRTLRENLPRFSEERSKVRRMK